MQAIQFFHHKCLMEFLLKLQQESISPFPFEHAELIVQHEVKLKEIYSNYQLALNQVSIIISQYEDHKRSVRKLVKQHKSYKRAIKGKNAYNIKFESF